MIEIPETRFQSKAQGSYLDLSITADDMVELCLEYKDHPEGSLASNIGMANSVSFKLSHALDEQESSSRTTLGADTILGSDGGLSLKMMSYRPVVSCRGTLSFTGQRNMKEIMKKMSAENVKRNFGRRGVPGVRVLLPLKFTSSG